MATILTIDNLVVRYGAIEALHGVSLRVESGQIVPAKIMRVNATFDHRFIDGFHASVMSRVLRQCMEHPYEHFDKI